MWTASYAPGAVYTGGRLYSFTKLSHHGTVFGVSGARSTKFADTSAIDLPPTRSKKFASMLFTSMPPIGTGTLASYHCLTNTSDAACEMIMSRYCEPLSLTFEKIG